jgi:hypothetical protein
MSRAGGGWNAMRCKMRRNLAWRVRAESSSAQFMSPASGGSTGLADFHCGTVAPPNRES